jgi:hypothetical protein
MQEGKAQVPASKQQLEQVGGTGRQAAWPPIMAASLKPEPLLGKLKDARILLSGKQYARTINFEPNSHTYTDKFSRAEIS